MRLGGWARIWIVLVVIYGLLVAFVAYTIQPTLNRTYQQWIDAASGAIATSISSAEGTTVSQFDIEAKLLAKSTQDNIAWLTQVGKSPTQAQRIFSSQVARINAKYGQQVASFQQRVLVFWLEAFGWWLLGAAVLYAIGWSIGWVFRGFRATAP